MAKTRKAVIARDDRIQDAQEKLGIDEATVPADVKAELSVIGSLLIDPEAIKKVRKFLNPNHFFRMVYEILYRSAIELDDAGTPIDSITLTDQAVRNGLTHEEARQNILDSTATTPTSLYIEHYANIVFDRWKQRYRLMLCGKYTEAMYDRNEEEAAQIIAEMNRVAAMSSEPDKSSPVHIRQALQAAVEETDKRSRGEIDPGIPTGMIMLDRLLNGGLQRGRPCVIAGRPGMGKSALAATIANNASKRGYKFLIFSLEMTHTQNAHRLISMESRVENTKIISGQNLTEEEWGQIMFSAEELAEQDIWLSYSFSIEEICQRTREAHTEHGVDVIVIDHIQLVSCNEGKDRREQVGAATRKLTQLGNELGIAVIILSQLNRLVEQRADKRPVLSDLRETGDIEQDAGLVIFIYREDYYDEESDRQNIADLIVAKASNGPTGTVPVFFHKTTTMFGNLEIERHELN